MVQVPKHKLVLEVPGGAKRVLLHTCCAPCSSAIIEIMLQQGITPTIFYSNSNIFPLFIGLMLTIIICTIGPLTDAGLNPARDLGPRIAAFICGIPGAHIDAMDIVVYTVGPLVGAGVFAWIYKGIFGKAHAAAYDANKAE